jgi:hypothetical protein
MSIIIVIIALYLSGIKFVWNKDEKSIEFSQIELAILYLAIAYFIRHF